MTADQNGSNIFEGILTGGLLGAASGAVIGLGGAFLTGGISSLVLKGIADFVNVSFFGGEWGSLQSYALAFSLEV